MSENSDSKPIDSSKSAANPGLSRRKFLSQAAMATAGFMIVPRHVLGGSGFTAPSDRLNIASVGIGGMGRNNTRNLADLGENIYALCDVDEEYAADVFGSYPSAKKYTDFREMLDKEPEIDAIVVSTPDNTHGAIAIHAMEMGKHAYVEKPLARTIYESRRMAQVAAETGVKTQMGNQGHARVGTYKIVEWIRQGAIGHVHEVHCWTDRPRGFWPQGSTLQFPDEIPAVPATMHWDLWVGPSPYRPYHPNFAPFAWRGYWDFGAGSLGDMGAHIVDQAFWALELGNPDRIQATSTPFTEASFPEGSTVHYSFPEKNGRQEVKLTWFDGGIMPPRPAELEQGRQMGAGGGGMIFYGSDGMLMADVYGDNPRFIPESRLDEVGEPQHTMERSPGIYEEWVKAIKEDGETTSNFEYAAALTEMMLLGNVAIRFSDRHKILEYDDANDRFTNLDDANDWLTGQKEEFRPGWKEMIG